MGLWIGAGEAWASGRLPSLSLSSCPLGPLSPLWPAASHPPGKQSRLVTRLGLSSWLPIAPRSPGRVSHQPLAPRLRHYSHPPSPPWSQDDESVSLLVCASASVSCPMSAAAPQPPQFPHPPPFGSPYKQNDPLIHMAPGSAGRDHRHQLDLIQPDFLIVASSVNKETSISLSPANLGQSCPLP